MIKNEMYLIVNLKQYEKNVILKCHLCTNI